MRRRFSPAFSRSVGFIWSAAAFRDVPRSGFLTSLGQAFEPGPIGDQPSLRTPEFEFYDATAFTFIGSSVVRAIAYLALAYAVTFLIVATRSRRPELPRFIVYITLVGAVLSAVASVFGGVGTVTGGRALPRRTADRRRRRATWRPTRCSTRPT